MPKKVEKSNRGGRKKKATELEVPAQLPGLLRGRRGRGRGRGRGQLPVPMEVVDPDTDVTSDSDDGTPSLAPSGTEDAAGAGAGADAGAGAGAADEDVVQNVGDDGAVVVIAKKARQKKVYRLTEQQEENLIEWIGENPILWNSKLKDFRRTDKKERLWEQKANELNSNIANLKGWWQGIKDQYTKLHRKKSGQAVPNITERQQWIIDHCHFLERIVRHKGASVRPVSIIIIIIINL